jgi:hypothetical protein
MKKIYSKPDVLFDSFSLCSSIASCEVEATFRRDVCGVEMAIGVIMFTDSTGSCNWKQEDGEYDGLCYHVPLEAYNVFSS